MHYMTMDQLGSLRDHTLYGPTKGLRFGPKIQGPENGPGIGTKIWSLIIGPYFYPWTLNSSHFGPLYIGPQFGPYA